MARNKTRDGYRLEKILDLARGIGATIREGTKHPYVLNYPGLRPCPIASSTNAKRMVAPWLAQATGYARKDVYTALTQGHW